MGRLTEEDLALEVLLEFFNGVEAGMAAAKQRLKERKGLTEKTASGNPANIKWDKAEGFKGNYERSEDVNNPEFKAMLKDLASHNGRLMREGYFYWTFKNGSTVGRKRREAKG
jgi:hypothetical protein